MAELPPLGPQGDGWDSPAAGTGPQDCPEQAKDLRQEDAKSDWSADSWSDYGSCDEAEAALGRTVSDGIDYILADCKTSEVTQFIAGYLEKVLEPSGWQAVWRTNVFEVLVGVADVNFLTLKAVVQLSEPFLCESQDSSFTLECMKELLELKEHQILLQELWLLHYDILEQRVPSGLVVDYQNLLSQREELYDKFLNVGNSISSNDSDSETENVSMVEGLELYDKVEHIKQRLKLIETPLLRYVFGYQKYGSLQAKGPRSTGAKVIHVVPWIMTANLLQLLTRDKLCPESCEALKLVQHDAVEGNLNVHHGKTTMENYVLQCETTGITVRTSAELLMKNSDLYGAKAAGVEIYPRSACTLLHNEIHHCKEGILVKNFLDEDYEAPRVTMVNNMIHNNEEYGVVLVKTSDAL
ncbi:SHC SH2 domain-binding protein 1 [Lonchura striata]|uniref:SHC SH2 domain-binding protein 1 n=1 Tax=Lonchura striata TaxID=40157 RepID=A0A218VD11_9PASE|nr:SHC SH2 domain-binding protein 1 [Lonchura striata domestica]